MKKLFYLFVSVLTLGIESSCSSNDDGGGGGDDGSGITGKWFYYQQRMIVGSDEVLYDAVEGCGDNYNHVELKSNGVFKEVWYNSSGSGCTPEIDESGTWSKNGNTFTISYDGEIWMQGEIKLFNDSTLKVHSVEDGVTYVIVFKRSLDDGGGDASAFAGQWEGTYTGDDSGIFSVTINNNGQINGNGSSTNWEETFTLSGTVNSDGSFNAGNTSTGATFTGTIIGNNLTGNWNNPTTDESGTFVGQKQ